MLGRLRAQGPRTWVSIAGWSYFTLALLGPLELRDVGAPLAGMWVSPFELLAAAVATLGGVAVWVKLDAHGPWLTGASRLLLRPEFVGLSLLVLLALASAAWSGEPAASFKFGLRLGGGVTLAIIAAALGEESVFRRRLIGGLLAGLAVITALATLERLVGQSLESVLSLFRAEPTWMLGEPRLSGVFYHANTFAAYLELTLPLLLVGAAKPGLSRRQLAVSGAWLLLAGGALSLTYSRAGLLAGVLGAGLLMVAARRAGMRRQAAVAGTFAALLVLAFGANPDMRARLGVGSREYKVEYTVHGVCHGVIGSRASLIVEVRNTGSWPISNRQAPGQLAWTLWDGGKLPGKEDFTFIDLGDVRAGQRVDVPVRFKLPPRPGRFTILFDVRRKDVIWLSSVGSDLGSAPCAVRDRGEPLLAADIQFTGHSLRTVMHRRAELSRKHYWQAAARLFSERPLLGQGADRFRVEHGRMVPAKTFDSRARAHSIVVETAADLGIAGLAALGLFIGGLAATLLNNLLRAGQISPAQLAASIATIAFALHSLVDYFLAYTKILAVLWPIVGLACSAKTTKRSASRSTESPATSPPA